MSNIPVVYPRDVDTDVSLVRGGQSDVAILYPVGDTQYAALAADLQAAIAQRTGAQVQIVRADEWVPQHNSRLPDEYRRRPLILLGNLNTNRALSPLYARYFCATDATYPGPGGYEVRTLVNPYGTQVNSLLLGGSDYPGVARAVGRLVEIIDARAQPGELVIPFTLDVSLSPELSRQLAAWPDTRLGAPIPEARPALLNAVGLYAVMYAWTGDARYGLFSRDCLRVLNNLYTDSYGDWHYAIEKIVRALPWLAAGGLLNQEEVLRTEHLLLGTAVGTARMWWRMSSQRPPLGHRHHGKGTFAFYLQARYLLDYANLNDAARQQCEQWVAECREFLDALVRARIDDQDDESTLNNLSTLVWYALGEERYDLFESGNAWLMAQRAIGVHDNMGAGAGVEGYGEGLLGAMYYQQEAGPLVAASAYYYQDGQLKWIRQRMPNLETPLRWDGWSLSPLFMHKFDTGDELTPVEPARLTGLRRLPISPYQVSIMRDPPFHVEPRGHFVDQPETWRPQGGVATTRLPESCAFDKLVFRGGFDARDPYLLLQGYHGGYRWQGSMHAINAIVRFSQAGHIFLIQNTNRQSYLHKNGLLISDGFDDTLISPAAEWLAVDDFPSTAISTTRVNEYHRTSWTRTVFWSKRGQGCFLVMDAVKPRQPGPYSVTCTWRTPGYAERHGTSAWRARQGEHLFQLTWGQDLQATSQAQGVQGAASPYVLRQVQSGDYQPDQWITFHNLFFVRHQERPEALRVVIRSPFEAVVLGDAGAQFWCGIDPEDRGLHLPGLDIRAMSALIGRDQITLSGATSMRIDGATWQFESDQPVGFHLDLPGNRLLVQTDTPGSGGVNARVEYGRHVIRLQAEGENPVEADCPSDVASLIKAALEYALGELEREPGSRTTAPRTTETASDWQPVWRFDKWQPSPEPIRDVVVTANPPPLDGFADQLVDGVTPEFRTLSAQWPDAAHIDLRLDLGREQPIDHIRIVGDSQSAPTLRVYRPLPDGIDVSVSSDGFQADARRCDEPRQPDVFVHRRFYTAEDIFEAIRVPVRQTARQIQVRVPRAHDGRPLVLHEIEVYGEQLRPPRVTQLIADDLDGDGRTELVAVSSAGEVIVLSDQGHERWRWKTPHAITHVSCHDLDGDGRRQVCIATLAREVILLEPSGIVRQTIDLARFQDKVADVQLGMLQAVNSIAIWHRAANGRGALVLGCYGLLAFLDTAGRMLGHSYVDGSWITDLQVVPGHDGPDIWARSRWNHGVNIYRGRADMKPSGANLVLGGVAQPLFRDCKRVLPFVTGDRVGFEQVEHQKRSYIVASNESGFGVLSIADESWAWKVEGGMPVTACIVAGLDGDAEPQVVVGGADGFVASFGLLNGRPLKRRLIGWPVTGLAAQPGESCWWAATRDRLLLLDPDWRAVVEYPIAVDALCALGKDAVIATPDGTLTRLAVKP